MSYLDILNYSHYQFDLSNYNIDLPIRYIKLQFNGTDHTHFNLKNVLFYKIKRYSKPYTYHIKVNYNSQNIVYMINSCEPASCDRYCDFNLYENQDYFSCIHGCDMFERYHYCDCKTSEFKESIFNYYNYNYNSDYCLFGCQYSFETYLGTNYTVMLNSKNN